MAVIASVVSIWCRQPAPLVLILEEIRELGVLGFDLAAERSSYAIFLAFTLAAG